MRERINKLLNSHVSAAEISRHTGLDASTIQKFRLGTRDVGKLSLESSERLSNYYEKICEEARVYDIFKTVKEKLEFVDDEDYAYRFVTLYEDYTEYLEEKQRDDPYYTEEDLLYQLKLSHVDNKESLPLLVVEEMPSANIKGFFIDEDTTTQYILKQFK